MDVAAFELLASLCTKTSKGQNAVAKSQNCQDCVERAMHVITELSGFDEGVAMNEDGNGDDADAEMFGTNFFWVRTMTMSMATASVTNKTRIQPSLK